MSVPDTGSTGRVILYLLRKMFKKPLAFFFSLVYIDTIEKELSLGGVKMNTITAAQPFPIRTAAVPALHDMQPLFAAYIAFLDRSETTAQSYIKDLRQFSAWLSYKGIEAPARQDIILYRDFLQSEHEAIAFDPVTGWRYRTDRTGRPLTIICKANTVAQYLRTVQAFFNWTAQSGIYPNIAAGVHGPKIRHDTHRKDALTPRGRSQDRAQHRGHSSRTDGTGRAGR